MNCRPIDFCLTAIGIFGWRVPIQDVQRDLHSVVRSLQRQACHAAAWLLLVGAYLNLPKPTCLYGPYKFHIGVYKQNLHKSRLW